MGWELHEKGRGEHYKAEAMVILALRCKSQEKETAKEMGQEEYAGISECEGQRRTRWTEKRSCYKSSEESRVTTTLIIDGTYCYSCEPDQASDGACVVVMPSVDTPY